MVVIIDTIVKIENCELKKRWKRWKGFSSKKIYKYVESCEENWIKSYLHIKFVFYVLRFFLDSHFVYLHAVLLFLTHFLISLSYLELSMAESLKKNHALKAQLIQLYNYPDNVQLRSAPKSSRKVIEENINCWKDNLKTMKSW